MMRGTGARTPSALRLKTRVQVLGVLVLASACDWEGFRYKDRELASCHPACLDASAVVSLARDAMAAVDAGTDDAESALDAPSEVHPDAGVDGGGRDADLNPDARPLARLEATQATPNTVVFGWDPEQLPMDLTGYELRVAAQRSVIETGGGDLWGPAEDCALDGRSSSRGGLVRSTRVLALEASMPVYGRLYARIGGSPVAVAEGMGETTAPRSSRLVLFADTLAGNARREGFLGPEGAAEAHDGSGALWVPPAASGPAILTGLERVVPGELIARWDTAYFELFMRVVPATALCELRVEVQGASEPRFFYDHVAVPGQERWARIQIPLRAFLATGDVVMSSGGLGGTVHTIALEADWPASATVYVDDIAIVY